MALPRKSVAVLCPGPSLKKFLADPVRHDLYIGVNRAAEAWPCDWWAFADEWPFRLGKMTPQGYPHIFTNRCVWERFSKEDPERTRRFSWFFYKEIKTSYMKPVRWMNYSSASAMILTEHLLAKDVTVYGADLAGAEDWDGPAPNISNRADARWRDEKNLYEYIAHWMKGNGVPFSRVCFEGDS